MTTRATRMSVKTAWTRAKVTVARSIADGGAAIAERVVEDEGSEAEERVALRVPRPDVATPGSEDPWNDEKWQKVKWTVFRDVAYNLGPFFEKHPGGNWLLNLAVGRDCTAPVSYTHLTLPTILLV